MLTKKRRLKRDVDDVEDFFGRQQAIRLFRSIVNRRDSLIRRFDAALF